MPMLYNSVDPVKISILMAAELIGLIAIAAFFIRLICHLKILETKKERRKMLFTLLVDWFVCGSIFQTIFIAVATKILY